jgi:hypothetical protein
MPARWNCSRNGRDVCELSRIEAIDGKGLAKDYR